MANSYLLRVVKVVKNVPTTKYDDKSGNSHYRFGAMAQTRRLAAVK